jgi:hypothetical protein
MDGKNVAISQTNQQNIKKDIKLHLSVSLLRNLLEKRGKKVLPRNQKKALARNRKKPLVRNQKKALARNRRSTLKRIKIKILEVKFQVNSANLKRELQKRTVLLRLNQKPLEPEKFKERKNNIVQSTKTDQIYYLY